MKYKKFLKKNKVFIIIIAVVALVALSYFFFFKGNGEPDFRVYEVSKKNVLKEISETGIVRPAQTINLAFEAQGKVAEIKVKSGDKVSAGQELVSLDVSELNLQVSQALASLQTSEARLDKVLAGASTEDIKVYETAVFNAEVSLRNKEQSLADTIADAESDIEQAYENMLVKLHDAYIDCDDAVRNKVDQLFDNPRGSNPQLKFTSSNSALDSDIENSRHIIETTLNSWLTDINGLTDSSDLNAYINKGEQNINQIKSFLDKVALAVNDLTSGSSLSQTTIDTWKTAVATARSGVSSALSTVVSQKQTISTAKITNETNINSARATVDTAVSSLKTAQDNLALKKATPREADLALAEAEVRQAEATLALRRENLRRSVLRSPIDGVVTMVDTKIGQVTSMNVPVVFVDSENDFEIKVDIYEEDIPWVKIGDPVDIEIVAFPDEILGGHVISINPAEKLVGGVVYYEVEISFDSEKESLRNGMTADVSIITDKRENVLAVPKNSIFKTGADNTVEVISNGVIEERNVRVGLEGSDGNVEIISGLGEGDEVIIR